MHRLKKQTMFHFRPTLIKYGPNTNFYGLFLLIIIWLLTNSNIFFTFSSCQKTECIQNNVCPANRVCRNQKCVNPCPGLCGINAGCSISNHVPRCHCLQGYVGNPSVSCKLSMNFSACILEKALVPNFFAL